MIPNVRAIIVEKDGQLFVAEPMLHGAGYTPRPFDVVRINGDFYELNGRISNGETAGWWLEPVDVEAEVERFTEAWEVGRH